MRNYEIWTAEGDSLYKCITYCKGYSFCEILYRNDVKIIKQ